MVSRILDLVAAIVDGKSCASWELLGTCMYRHETLKIKGLEWEKKHENQLVQDFATIHRR